MSDELKPMVRKIYEEVYNKGNLDLLDDLIDPKYIRHQPPMKTVQGLDAYKKFITEVRNAYTNFEIRLDEILVDGNKSVVRITLSGKHTGKTPTLLAPPTGKDIAMVGCAVATWENGKIVEEWVYNDYMGLTYQFGVMPLAVGGFE
ncbi:MAG: ester cyclase [Desulfobacteraceae bacterium]|jgi:predicted ester cyclase